jgi:hypothetical protein
LAISRSYINPHRRCTAAPTHSHCTPYAPLPSWLTQVGSLVQAATNFKLAKLWDEAGGAFLKLAECHEQVRAL